MDNQGTAGQVNRILGTPVMSTSGQNLGTLNNLIVNYTAGKVDLGVLSLNQSAGGNSGQLVAVPWSTLHASNPESGSTQPFSFVFTGDPAKLQSAPSFSQNNWPDVSQASWRKNIYSYYGVTPPTYAESTGTATTSQTASQDVWANKIQGSAVLSSTGQNLGTLTDIIVNYNAGTIDLGLASLNASAGGTSGQLVPVPWNLLRASSQGATAEAASTQPLSFVFAGDATILHGAPSFSQNNWPNVNQPSWRQAVYAYYGVYGGGESPGGLNIGSVNWPGTTTTYKPGNDMQEQRPVGPTNQFYYPYYQYSGQ
jgi:sporulation protein YlmC with PRC-barrel domain